MKEKIMTAAFSLLEKKDMNSISIREIARKAGVNVSAVSYYFGGKEKLFACMMEQYWEDLRQLCLEILATDPLNKEQAKQFCLRFLRKEMSSTGVLRSEQIMYQNYEIDDATKERIQLQFQAFTHLITQCSPKYPENSQLIRIKILSLLSSLTHPAFWQELTAMAGDDLEDFMQAYTDHLVEQL